jgi:uncharacterized iron-regulated membrane protein
MGAKLRKVFFWTHLVFGLAAAVMILVMCVTGVLMTYERQIQSWADRAGMRSGSPSDARSPLPLGDLIARVKAVKGVDPEYVTVFSGPTPPVEVYLNREIGSVYADAYTGAIIGEPSWATASAFRKIRAWHRWLGATGPSRPHFRAVMDAANAVFLFLTVFGLYLWFPRQWTWRHLRAVLLFRRGLAGRARDFNWHNVIGLWTAIPLIVIVWTGMAMSYPWARNLTYRAAGTPKPVRAEAGAADADEMSSLDSRLSGLDSLMAQAGRQTPGWKAITLELPETATEPLDFTIDMSGYDAIGESAELELDRSSTVRSFTPAGKEAVTAKSFIRYGHTGELWGVAGQTVAGMASLGGVFLIWTGVSLSWRRLRSWQSRRARRGGREPVARHPAADSDAKAA